MGHGRAGDLAELAHFKKRDGRSSRLVLASSFAESLSHYVNACGFDLNIVHAIRLIALQ